MNRVEATRRAERQVKVARIDTNVDGVITTEWELSNNRVITTFEDEESANAECAEQRKAVADNLVRSH